MPVSNPAYSDGSRTIEPPLLRLWRNVKAKLKCSGFLVAIVRASRLALEDMRKLSGFVTRQSKIRRYLRNHKIKKLQLGTSNSALTGWLNTDVLPKSRQVVYLDAARAFPFENDAFDYVFSEHMIEHISYEDGISMLAECFRIIRPGGKIRLSTPDLKVYTNLHTATRTPDQDAYVCWMIEKLTRDSFIPPVDCCQPVFVINNAFRAWGHQFLYDRETLMNSLAQVGFENITFFEPNISNDENLRGIEFHGAVTDCEWVNQFEAFAIEGSTPIVKKRLLKLD